MLRPAGGQVEEVAADVRECMAVVERVAASQELKRAARLREFLLYVCAQTLEHGATGLHEQEIGEAVFGRPRSYDTNVDNIVRVNATSLRKRLEHYFEEEGAAEPLVIEIPRGSYTPVFRRRAVEPTEPLTRMPQGRSVPVQATPAEPLARIAGAAPERRRAPAGWVALSAALLLLCAVLLWQNRQMDRQLRRWKAEPALRAFWGEFFGSGGETDVVLADTSFAVAEDMMQRTISLSDYLDFNYKRLAEAPGLSADQRRDLDMVLDRNNGSIGDFRVARQILDLNADGQRAVLRFAREYTTAEAKRNGLVLIGSAESNPWVGLFSDELNFALEYDPVTRRAFITNRAPHAGEQATYTSAGEAPVGSHEPPGGGYGVIAYVPNLSGTGKTLVLEGTDSQATAATGEFMTSEESLASFESRFPAGRIPSFEILLRTSQLSGTPLHAEMVAFRIYPAKPSVRKP